jgi:hypothetical protein
VSRKAARARTKFEEQIDEDREQQHEAAKRIAEPLESQDEDSSD